MAVTNPRTRSRTPLDERDEWRTPRWVFLWAEAFFGRFEIDLAATVENSLCKRCYTKQVDGLTFAWHRHADRGWCNPPYSRPIAWVRKAAEESDQGFRTVMLLPSPQGDARDELVFAAARRIVFVTGIMEGKRGRPETGRIAFDRPDGTPTEAKGGNMRGSMLVEFAPGRLEPLAISRQAMQRAELPARRRWPWGRGR